MQSIYNFERKFFMSIFFTLDTLKQNKQKKIGIQDLYLQQWFLHCAMAAFP